MKIDRTPIEYLKRLNTAVIGIFLILSIVAVLPRNMIAGSFSVFASGRGLGVYVFFVTLVGIFVIAGRLSDWKRPLSESSLGSVATAIVSLTLILVSAAIRAPFKDYPGLWAGFGIQPSLIGLAAAVTILVQPFDFEILLEKKLSRLLILHFLPLLVVGPRLLLFLQPPNGLINLGDTSYHVIDEILAPFAGRFPYSNYSPQYTGALGWIFFPIRFFGLEAESTLRAVIIFCNFCNLLVPVLVVAIARTICARVNRTLSFLSFVALWTVCGTDLGYSTQIREFSQFARYVPSLLALWLALRSVRTKQIHSRQISSFIAGVSVGFSFLNSADYGLSLTVALIAGYFVGYRASRISRAQILSAAAGFLVLLGTYVVLLLTTPDGLSLLSYIGLRGSALEGNVYGGTIGLKAVGPHLLVLVVPLLLSVKPPNQWEPTSPNKFAGIDIAATVVAIWILMLSAKFFLFPIAPATVPLFVPAYLGGVIIFARIDFSHFRERLISEKIQFAPILLLFFMSLSAVLPSSNVSTSDELRRISGSVVNRNDWSTTPGRPVDGYSLAALSKEDDFLIRIDMLRNRVAARGTSIGYFGPFGNTVNVVLDLDNYLGIAAPESMRFGTAQERLACVPVISKQPMVLLVYASPFPCHGYTLEPKLSDDLFKVYRLTETRRRSVDRP